MSIKLEGIKLPTYNETQTTIPLGASLQNISQLFHQQAIENTRELPPEVYTTESFGQNSHPSRLFSDPLSIYTGVRPAVSELQIIPSSSISPYSFSGTQREVVYGIDVPCVPIAASSPRVSNIPSSPFEQKRLRVGSPPPVDAFLGSSGLHVTHSNPSFGGTFYNRESVQAASDASIPGVENTAVPFRHSLFTFAPSLEEPQKSAATSAYWSKNKRRLYTQQLKKASCHWDDTSLADLIDKETQYHGKRYVARGSESSAALKIGTAKLDQLIWDQRPQPDMSALSLMEEFNQQPVFRENEIARNAHVIIAKIPQPFERVTSVPRADELYSIGASTVSVLSKSASQVGNRSINIWASAQPPSAFTS
eukprot:Gregarina_sp_Poly_1__9721@NODE_618_length_7121_cov_156_723845_g474_i0_p3_GENE_NODE_618_length_7121_cov_156_723845_g474_i0NODE_618_length_7121_cov_156_723845_g474_i0_p3_ORF_typecomplete_len365_score42_12_NODE_618_length_7121_cov_156_723845_g474_i019633057